MGGQVKGFDAVGTPAKADVSGTQWSPTFRNDIPVGYSATAAPQTAGIESKPSWMTGAWDAPWWGTNASTGQPMSNADLAPQNWNPHRGGGSGGGGSAGGSASDIAGWNQALGDVAAMQRGETPSWKPKTDEELLAEAAARYATMGSFG